MGLKTWAVSLALRGKLPKFVYRMAGRKIAEILDLKENDMSEEMKEGEGKKWWKSKSILNGIVIVIIGTYETVRLSLAPQMGWNLPAIPEFLYVILGAIGIYSRKVADTKIAPLTK